MILDGYGLSDKAEGNAIAEAKTPVMDALKKEYPFVFETVFENDMTMKEIGECLNGKSRKAVAYMINVALNKLRHVKGIGVYAP